GQSTVDIYELGNMLSSAPKYSAVLLAFVLASMGAPFFGNFFGEWLVLWASFLKSPIIAIFASVGILLLVIYSLWLFQRLGFSNSNKSLPSVVTSDLTKAEISIYGLVIALLLVLGLCPGIIIK